MKCFIVIIRAIWSPSLCLFEKIENLNSINDKKQDLYQRVLTFESENTPCRAGFNFFKQIAISYLKKCQ